MSTIGRDLQTPDKPKTLAMMAGAFTALLMASLIAGGAPAFAQRAKPAEDASAKVDSSKVEPPPTKDQLAKGMKDAPALLQAAGATCTVSNATFRGAGKTSDGAVDIYEAACKEGPGYLLIKNAKKPVPEAFDCISAAAGGTKCILPGDTDSKTQIAPLVAASGRACTVSDVNAIGISASTRVTYYEVACGSAPGFRLGVPPGPSPKLETIDCLALLDTPGACKLTTRAQAMASLTPLVQASGRACPISNARYVGVSDQTNSTYYEVACGSGAGFIIGADTKTNAYKQVIDCARAGGLAGGCKLTDASVTQSAALSDYSQKAAKAGFPCKVSRFREVGVDSKNREIVELACSDRPDGGLAAFADNGPSTVYDCVRAGGLGQKCQLTSPAPIYAKYTAALLAKGRGSCKVSDATWLGVGSSEDLVETACTDGKPGWVIGFKPGTESIVELLSCRQAAALGLACHLPTNVAGNKGS